MTDPNDERRLRGLLDDAVSDIEPRNALDQIRARTKENPMNNRRAWILGVGGAAAATAATIAVIAVVGTPGGDKADPDPAGASDSVTGSVDPSTDITRDQTGVSDPSTTGEPAGGKSTAVGVYYLGDTPSSSALYREFHRVPDDNVVLGALREATAVEPADPDYRTPWRGLMTVASAEVDGDVIRIGLSDAARRPSGMTGREAELAVQQLIYTAQAAAQKRLPAQFEVGGNPVAQTLGVPTSEPLAEGKELEVLSLVSLTSPSEGQAITDGRLRFDGRASSFEATVPWQIRKGDKVVKRGFVNAGGWVDRLYPFEGQANIGNLAPGTYTFAAMTDDPTGGTEGNGPSEDTRTIVVK